MSFEITGFDHMVLKCRDLDKALWFYGEVLGMGILRLDHYHAGNCGFPSVRVSDGILIDLPPDNSTDPIVENADHFCLVIEPTDMVALQQELRGRALRWRNARPTMPSALKAWAGSSSSRTPTGTSLSCAVTPKAIASFPVDTHLQTPEVG